VSQENKAAVRGLYDAINAGDLGALADAIADNVVEHEDLPGVPPGKAGVVQFFKTTIEAMQGFRMSVDEIMAEGDRVSVLGTATGKHTGEYMGIPATGKDLTVPFSDYFRVENGKVAEHWGVMDSGAMLMQMGVMKMPG
jgi:steroid delta-isomerase-like uncharacterized protein